jgi:hypothetical protein
MSIRSPHRWLLAAAVLAIVPATPIIAAEPPEDLEALQKKMLRQLLTGNPSPDELRKMVADMNKLMLKEFPELQPFAFPELLRNELQPFRVMPLPPLNRQPPVFPQPFPRRGRIRPEIDLPPPPAVTDEQLKEFDEQIEKLKDNPEAQAELRKARDEYKKALEEGLKKGDPNRDPLPAPQSIQAPPPPLPQAQRLPIDINVPVFPERVDRLLRPAGPVRLGVVFETPSAVLGEHLNLPADVGVLIVEVQAGSPAEKAGLRPNDVVVKLGGKDAPSELPRFQQLVAELKGGEKLEAEYYRKGKKATAQIQLAPAGR